MKASLYRSKFTEHQARSLAMLLIVALLAFSNLAVFAHPEPKPISATAQESQDAPKIPNDQLDSLNIVKQMELYNPDRTWRRTDDAW